MEVWTKSCKTSTSNIFYTLGNAFSFGFSYPFQIAIASYGDIVYYIIVCVNATSIRIVRSSRPTWSLSSMPVAPSKVNPDSRARYVSRTNLIINMNFSCFALPSLHIPGNTKLFVVANVTKGTFGGLLFRRFLTCNLLTMRRHCLIAI